MLLAATFKNVGRRQNTPNTPENAANRPLSESAVSGGILFREYCFGEGNSLSFEANSVSSAENSVSSPLHTNNRLKGTH